MCGILGAVVKSPVPNSDWLASSLATMNHRGPDDSGLFYSVDGRVGLGHKRLSIIDLSPAGHQPMLSQDETRILTFNGEIYNFKEIRVELLDRGYTFRSATDSEVILAAYARWGENCVSQFRGMFAFCIYDKPAQTLFLARDRAGEKPLYFRFTNTDFSFASELKALLEIEGAPRNINSAAFDYYLATGFVPVDECILKDYKKLPPAHTLTFNITSWNCSLKQYWSLPKYSATADFDRNENGLLERLEILLEDSVRHQLVADVPVGILLSGGLDSSIITALAARNSEIINTFTISFPGHSSLDESHHARKVAEFFGTDHHTLNAEPTTVDILPELAAQFDEPLADSSLIPTWLVTKLVRQHCKVALGGDGGDELFGGYNHHQRLKQLEKNMRFIPAASRKAMAAMADGILPVGFKGRSFIQGLNYNLKSGLPVNAVNFEPRMRDKLVQGFISLPTSAEALRARHIPENNNVVQRATRADFCSYLPEDILVKIDRCSMSNSLELRSPMLDHTLIEFAFSNVSASLKTNEFERKIILKKLAKKLLPQDLDINRKQGFTIPLASWLRGGPFRNFFWEILTDPSCCFDQSTVLSLLRGQDRGYSNSERLFTLVQFELWRKHFSARP